MSEIIPENLHSPNISDVISKETETRLEEISVCICTYLRPEMLSELIEGLLKQKTYDQFLFSLIIVDNDPAGSAKDVVDNYIANASASGPLIRYYHQPVKGLTYARNMSIENSSGDYIAFIDDDEVPEPEWLYQLYKSLVTHKADAVFGSVIPNFEVTPPEWILKHNFFYWRDVRTGTGMDVGTAVTTNNALVRRDLIKKYNIKFDHDFAFSGGEDQAFFFKLMDYKEDVRFINCENARVHETLPPERCTPEYIRKRFLLEGGSRTFGIHKFSHTKFQVVTKYVKQFLQSSFRLILLSMLMILCYFIKRDLFNTYYYKAYYHIGVLAAIFKYTPYSDRKSIGLL